MENRTINTKSSTIPDEAEESDELVDLEEFAKSGRKPPRARTYRIRIDKDKYDVEKAGMTGRELLALAGKTPATSFMISQKMHGGEARNLGLDERADFTQPGVERFMTLPLDQQEGRL